MVSNNPACGLVRTHLLSGVVLVGFWVGISALSVSLVQGFHWHAKPLTTET